MNQDDELYNSIMGIQPSPEEEEQSLIRKLAAQGMTGLQYVGETLDKPGQALRGLLAGKPAELLNLIPFSDALGITSSEGLLGKYGMNVTDDEDAVSGRDLLEKVGWLGENQEGLDWGDVAGFAADVVTDPTTYMTLGASALGKAGKALKNAGMLADPFIQAKRLGKAVKGQAGARHALTADELLSGAKPEQVQGFLNAYFKGQGAGKTLADVEGLAEPVGGLFNFAGKTVHMPRVAEAIDTATGGLRYGTGVARGLNAVFDAGHSVGKPGESRYAQEFLIPNQKLYQQEILNELNPQIAQLKATVAKNVDALTQAYPNDPDLVNQVYQAIEGVGPDVAGLHDINQKLASTVLGIQRGANIPVSDLYDDFAEYAARRKIMEGGQGGVRGVDPQAALTKSRAEIFKNIPGGTAENRNIFKFMADAREKGIPITNPQKDEAEHLADMLKQQFPNVPTKYNTKEAEQALDELALGPVANPQHYASLQKTVQEGTDLDRMRHLALYGLSEPVETLKAGLFMDPAGAAQIVANATAEKASRSKAFVDAINDPSVMNQYAGSPMIGAAEAAKALGIDPAPFANAAPVPESLVQELLPKKVEPRSTGIMGMLGDAAKQVTALNKAAMTGAIFNPSFSTRNRASGGLTNVYEGNTGALGALKGLAHFLTGGLYQTDASKIARGGVVPGLAQDPAIAALAARQGRQLADDVEATDFVREMVAAYGGRSGGKHTADNLVEKLTGQGEFVGGMAGESGPDAFGWGRVASEAGKTFDQLRGKEGGVKELFLGAPGVAFGNEGVARQAPTSALLKSGQTVNDYVEAQNRVGPFLEMLRKGIDPSEAMRRVNRAQISYDPRNYTDIENKYLTTIFPFYKFLKESSKGHADELLEKPGGGLSQLLQAGGQLHDPEEILPEYIKENIAIPVNQIPGLNKLFGTDNPEESRYLTGLGLGFEQPLQFVHGGKRGDLPFQNALWELLGAANPALIKMPIETVTGHSTFQQDETGFGRLVKNQDPSVGRMLNNIRELMGGEKTVDPHVLPGTIEAILANSPLTRVIGAMKNLTDTREKGTRKAFSNYLFGPKLTDVSESAKEGVVRELANQLIDQIPGSRQMTDFYIPKKVVPHLSEEDIRNRDIALLLKRLQQKHAKSRETALANDPLAELFSL